MFEPNKEYLYTRFDFERNFNLLAELLIQEKFKFANGLQRTIDSILKVRKLPNGRLDLNTINELARLTANTAANMENMDIKEEKD